MALDPLTAGLDFATSVVNKIWPDKTEQERAELAGALALIQGQLEVNKVEAASTNWFVAGARPFIMWICGCSLLYAALFEPLARFVAVVIYNYAGLFPVIDTNLTTQILLGLLGLGGFRTIEKLKNVEKNR